MKATTIDPRDFRTWTLEYKLAHWRRSAEWYCRRDPRKEHMAEDFGSYVVQQILENPKRGINLHFQYFSFHEQAFGFSMRKAGAFVSFDSLEATKARITHHYEEVSDWARLADELHFHGWDRVLFLLAWQYGLTRTELMHLTEKSGPSLSQIFTYQENCIRKHLGMPARQRRKGRKFAAEEYWKGEAVRLATLGTELAKYE